MYVEKKKDVPAKERIPTEIDGIPTDVVEDKIEPHQNMVRLEDIVIEADTATYTPLVGGISIGPCRSFHLTPPEVATEGDYVFTGTLGCIVRDLTTDAAMALSNFHVMCVDDTWAMGDAMAQPSRVDTGTCPADTIGTLQRAVLNQSVDCAVSSISGRQVSCAVTEIGDLTGTAVAVLNEAVRKRGRTTGLTHGTIASIDYSTNVDYGDGLGTVTLKNQIRIVPDTSQSASFGNKGDSGSVVVNANGEVVGLYFAGNTSGTTGVANPIAAVLTALNVKICTGVVKKLEHKEFLTKELIPENASTRRRSSSRRSAGRSGSRRLRRTTRSGDTRSSTSRARSPRSRAARGSARRGTPRPPGSRPCRRRCPPVREAPAARSRIGSRPSSRCSPARRWRPSPGLRCAGPARI